MAKYPSSAKFADLEPAPVKRGTGQKVLDTVSEGELTSDKPFRPSPEDKKKIEALDKMYEEAKEARQHKVGRWRRNEELMQGQLLKPFNLPKYKNRTEPNFIFPVVETNHDLITDRPPKVDVLPAPKSDDPEAVEKASEDAILVQETVMEEWERCDAVQAIAGMRYDGLVYGIGFVKGTIRNGKCHFAVPDVYSVFPDPLATKVENAKYVIFVTPRYVIDIAADYPDGKYVKTEGRVDEFRAFRKYETQPEQTLTQVTDTTGARTDYFEEQGPLAEGGKGDYGGGMALEKECWYWEEGQLRLCTWAGNILLQDKGPDELEGAGIDEIPLVAWRNYASPHDFWGEGEPEKIESIVIGNAIMMSQAIDNMVKNGNPERIRPISFQKIPGNRPTDRPGHVAYVKDPRELAMIKNLPPPPLSAHLMPMLDVYRRDKDAVSRVHDITYGRQPTGVTAFRAIAALQEAAQQGIRKKERESGKYAVVPLFRQTIKLLRRYEQPIIVKKSGDAMLRDEYRAVMPDEIATEVNLRYVPGSSMSDSRGARLDEAMELLGRQILQTREEFLNYAMQGYAYLKKLQDQEQEQKRRMQEEMLEDMQILQRAEEGDPSISEDDIMGAKLRIGERMGSFEQPGGQAQAQPAAR